MIRIFSNILQFILGYFVLTIIEPFRVLFPRESAPVKKKKRGQTATSALAGRHPAPSIFRSIYRQRQMMSPSADFVPLSSQVSVTQHYVHLENEASARDAENALH